MPREGLGVGIVGDRVYGYPGGEMLLHASRLVVPRGTKPTIDVTAPLPERFGEWARPRDSLGSMMPTDLPEDALSEKFLAATGPGGQNVNKVATAVPVALRRVQARAQPRRLCAAEDHRRQQADQRRRTDHHRAPLSARRKPIAPTRASDWRK